MAESCLQLDEIDLCVIERLLLEINIKRIKPQIGHKLKWQIINGIFGAFKILGYLCRCKYQYYDICSIYKVQISLR